MRRLGKPMVLCCDGPLNGQYLPLDHFVYPEMIDKSQESARCFPTGHLSMYELYTWPDLDSGHEVVAFYSENGETYGISSEDPS